MWRHVIVKRAKEKGMVLIYQWQETNSKAVRMDGQRKEHEQAWHNVRVRKIAPDKNTEGIK